MVHCATNMDLSDTFKERIDALPEDIRLQCLEKFKGGDYHKKVIKARFSNNQIIEMYEIMAVNGLKDQTAFLHASHSLYIRTHKKLKTD